MSGIEDDKKDKELDWKFIQSFGDDNSSDDDLVTAVEYDETGDYLAVGDKAGRICIFEGKEDAKRSAKRMPTEYKFYTEFQSHEPEFDSLKSLEIEEKINMIKWGKRSPSGLFLLAANDKTIKFWKVHEKKVKKLTVRPPSGSSKFSFPRLSHTQSQTATSCKRVFSNAHQYHINSISLNSDGETFISADDLRINLWNLNISNESFNIVDLKPDNLEELTEVITSASFHPTSCNYLLYSSSRGSLRLGDLRDSALCDQHAKTFEVEEDPSSKSFFSEIISSISDSKFTKDGRFIVSRDYLTLKLWDMRRESSPVHIVNIHDYLKMHLCDLYENDCIFDKFECDSSSDTTKLLTGSYNNNFVIHDLPSNSSIVIEAPKDPPKSKKGKKKEKPELPNVNMMDFGKKALHVAWHPRMNAVAIAGLNKLYLYQAL